MISFATANINLPFNRFMNKATAAGKSSLEEESKSEKTEHSRKVVTLTGYQICLALEDSQADTQSAAFKAICLPKPAENMRNLALSVTYEDEKPTKVTFIELTKQHIAELLDWNSDQFHVVLDACRRTEIAASPLLEHNLKLDTTPA